MGYKLWNHSPSCSWGKAGVAQSGRYETISWHCGLGMGGKASTVGPWYHNPLARKHWQSSLSLKAVGQALVAVLGWNQLQGTRFIGATAAAPKFAVLIWSWERYTMRSWVNTQVSLARWKVWGVGIMQGPVRWSLLPYGFRLGCVPGPFMSECWV